MLHAAGWVVALTVFTYFGTRGAGESWYPDHHELDVLAYVLALGASLLLVAVWPWPVPVLVLTSVLGVAYRAIDYPGGPVYLAPIVAAGVVGWREPLRRGLVVCVVAGAGFVAATALHPYGGPMVASMLETAAWALLPVVPWALVALLRLNRTTARQSAAERQRRRVDEERLRMAREVHDVVGHSLAVISMQAGVALHVADRRPEQARVALEAIKRSSGDALTQLRGALAVFVGDDPSAEVPGASDVPALVDDFRAGGRRVELALAADGLPPAVNETVYRIVQESLTNAARHSAATATSVSVVAADGCVVVEVTDGGPAVAAPSVPGRGLVGMRERCATVGGTLVAGPGADGGWTVRADLPLRVGVRA
ncbi:sensor histidine kinase [Jatrophihabitans fulvus]